MLSLFLSAAFSLFILVNASVVEQDLPVISGNLSTPEHLSGNTSQIIRARNEQSDEAEFIPHKWTSEPECLTDTNTQQIYCIYTSKTFASNRGISFFTTPQIASKVLTLPSFTTPHPKHINSYISPPWEIRNTPGRGNGLFATQTLKRGDLILADTPLGVYNSEAFFTDYGMGYKYLRKSFEGLPVESKELFLKMATNNEGDIVMERINTNAFAGEFEGENHFLLYPETALMNHDCRPNAMYYHNTSTLVHAAYASRTILPGEEITIPYINLLQSREERQNFLKAMWGFQCTCKACSTTESETAHADKNIQKIIDYHTKLADWSGSSLATPKMAKALLALYEKEHLHAALGTGHMFAALSFNAVGDTANAIEHAKKALDLGMVSSESIENDERDMKSLLQRPIAHWSYMRRANVG